MVFSRQETLNDRTDIYGNSIFPYTLRIITNRDQVMTELSMQTPMALYIFCFGFFT